MSAKLGTGVEELFPAIIERIPRWRHAAAPMWGTALQDVPSLPQQFAVKFLSQLYSSLLVASSQSYSPTLCWLLEHSLMPKWKTIRFPYCKQWKAWQQSHNKTKPLVLSNKHVRHISCSMTESCSVKHVCFGPWAIGPTQSGRNITPLASLPNFLKSSNITSFEYELMRLIYT